MQETLDFDPKLSAKGRRTTAMWQPVRRDTMATAEMMIAENGPRVVREKTPPRCPSPTKRIRGKNLLYDYYEDD